MPLNCVGVVSPAFLGELELPARYLDIDHIGEGKTCVVVKALDSFLDRKVAIKFMRSELSDYASIRRFQQEARMMSGFNLKHLPIVLDFGLSPSGRPYMVMELVEGQSLKELIEKRCRLDVRLAMELAIQILCALDHAHERGIVHRDLKAQNVMVSWLDDGSPLVKLVDFGLAGEINRPHPVTAGSGALGTPYYMSPEQGLSRAADGRSDLYSLGCVMFEMLTGHTPFEKNSAAETIGAHVRDVAPKLRSVAMIDSCMASELERVVAKLLEKNPANRFQTAKELREELEDMLVKMRRGRLRAGCGYDETAIDLPVSKPLIVEADAKDSSFEAALKKPKIKFSLLRLVSLIPYLVLVLHVSYKRWRLSA